MRQRKFVSKLGLEAWKILGFICTCFFSFCYLLLIFNIRVGQSEWWSFNNLVTRYYHLSICYSILIMFINLDCFVVPLDSSAPAGHEVPGSILRSGKVLLGSSIMNYLATGSRFVLNWFPTLYCWALSWKSTERFRLS